MRKSTLALAAVAAFLFTAPAFAQSIELGPGGVRFHDGRPRGGGCAELRRACEMRQEGSCLRYRETCLRPVRRESCAELRAACLNKERLGEVGEGNCRRYRQMCR